MAEFEQLSSKPKSSFFNRSQTMHGAPIDALHKPFNNPSFERAASIKKTYSSSIKGKVSRLRSFFESTKSSKHATNELPSPTKSKLPKTDSKASSTTKNTPPIHLPGTEDRIVVYFTSLHGIRRTYEDCYVVRMIFKGFRINVDERDISMDSAYRKELQGVLGEKNVSLPQVFIRGRHVGGSEVIKQLHETGELAKVLVGFPVIKPGYVCDGCGGVRFMPCTNCDGSKKVFDVDEDVLKRCLECNENGLIRCSNCCS